MTSPSARREWKQRRRRKWLHENGPCQGCGSVDRLEVDHIDRSTKNKNVFVNIWGRREDIRLQELAKCQVLCHQCHKAKTMQERHDAVPHGTQCMYLRGCRCETCRTNHNKQVNFYKKRRRAELRKEGMPYS